MWLKRAFLLLLSIALSTASANAEEASTQPQISNFTLAYQGPLTGPEAQLGLPQLQGVKFAIAKHNAANPGKIVRLIEVDDQGDPAIANQVAPAVAANSSIIGLVGPAYSGATRASLPYYKPAGLPLITPTAGNHILTNPSALENGIPYFHRVIPTYFYGSVDTTTSEGSVLIRRAATQTTLNKIFIVREYEGLDIANDLIATLKALGATNDSLITLLSSDPTDSDFNQVAATLKARGAASVIFAGYSPATAVGVIKALKVGGYSGKYSVTSLTNTTEFKTLAGIYGNNVELTTEQIPLKDASATLASEFVSKMGTQPGEYATAAINATNVFLAGIKAGVTTRQGMSTYIDSYKGTGVAGNTIQFTANGELTDPSWGTYTITNSQLVYKGIISVATFAKKLPQTITFAPPSTLTMAQSPYTVTATSTSGLIVTLTSSTTGVCTVSGKVVTLVTTGTCTLTASQAGSSVYSPAANVTASIEVTLGTQTITFAPPSTLTMAQSPYTVTATSTSGLIVTLTSSTTGVCTVSGKVVTLVTTGTCTLTASQAGSSVYSPAANVTASIEVTLATQTITLTAPSTIPFEAGFYRILEVSSTSGLPVTLTSTPQTCTVNGTLISLLAVGQCVIFGDQNGDETFSAATTFSQVITITENVSQNSPVIRFTAYYVQSGGRMVVGSRLTENNYSVRESMSPGNSYIFSWWKCPDMRNQKVTYSNEDSSCSVIGLGGSYTLKSSDLGFYIVASVTFWNSSGIKTTWSGSDGFYVHLSFTSLTSPVLDPSKVVGNTLTTTDGVYTGGPIKNIRYMWLRCTNPINAGEINASFLPSGCSWINNTPTTNRYILADADIGYFISSVIILDNNIDQTQLFSSASTLKIEAAD
jgi:branched-chain amino acid transport system substrate-binding protein